MVYRVTQSMNMNLFLLVAQFLFEPELTNGFPGVGVIILVRTFVLVPAGFNPNHPGRKHHLNREWDKKKGNGPASAVVYAVSSIIGHNPGDSISTNSPLVTFPGR